MILYSPLVCKTKWLPQSRAMSVKTGSSSHSMQKVALRGVNKMV